MAKTMNSGKRWTAYGVNRLVHLSASGKTRREIGKILSRTPNAIKCKARRVKRAAIHNVRFSEFVHDYMGVW